MKHKMTKTKPGLLLGKIETSQKEPSPVSRYLFYLLLSLLGVGGMFGCFLTAFSIPLDWALFSVFTLIFVMVFPWIMIQKRFKLWIVTGITILGMLSVLLFHSYVQNGILCIYNRIVSTYMENSKYQFFVFSLSISEQEQQLFCTVTLIFLAFFMVLLLDFFLTQFQHTIVAVLLTVPFIGAALIFNIIPNLVAVGMLLCFWAFLLFGRILFQNTKGKRKKRRIGGRNYIHPAAISIVAVFSACMVAIFTCFPSESYQRAPIWDNLQTQLKEVSTTFSNLFSKSGQVGNATNYVNLRTSGNIEYTGDTVLQVKSDSIKTRTYLKGFVGSVYDGDGWRLLEGEGLSRYPEGLPQAQLFSEQLIQNLPMGDEIGRINQQMEIKNIAVNSKCVYLPYGISNHNDGLERMEPVQDGFYRAKGLGIKEYQVTYYPDLKDDAENLTLYDRIAYQLNIQSSSVMQQYHFNHKDWSVEQKDNWRWSDEINDTGIFSSQAVDTIQTVQEYTNFVSDTYTQLPEHLRNELLQYLEQNGLESSSRELDSRFISDVLRLVHSSNRYTLTPGDTPEGEDFITYFLFQNHQGYCRHFASAVTALFRAAGIPARYVEGYTVSPTNAQNKDGWYNIPDSSAHAWVEIYSSGIGWIPIEATPGTDNRNNNNTSLQYYSDTVPEEQDTSSSTYSETPSPSPGIQMEVEQENGIHWKGFIPYTIVIVIFLLSTIGLIMNRKVKVSHRKKQLLQPDRNKAVLGAYQYIEKMIQFHTPKADISKRMPTNLYQLVLKARFSQHTITQQELDSILDYTHRLERKLYEQLPFYKQFMAKYWKGLF
ncbi:transglutaminaseTgpA domain-containing protein [Massilioclostridium coli]|uniref:transglutaminase family protein n=1 Tax=Massilioclostridium coli TaxID=1870991 RepID=UPI00085C619C|nr:transglutaminase domain-containing protein [Massilioclostridium coli]